MSDMPWFASVAVAFLVLAIATALCAAVAALIVEQQDENDRGGCFDSGGRVEFYDAARQQAWRCLGVGAER